MNKIEPRWIWGVGVYLAFLGFAYGALSKSTAPKSLVRRHGMGSFWVAVFLLVGCAVAGVFTYLNLMEKLLPAGTAITVLTLVLSALSSYSRGENWYKRWYNKICVFRKVILKVVVISFLIICLFSGLVLILGRPLPFYIVYIICSIIIISITVIYLLLARPK